MRKRLGMYIGDTDDGTGLHHMVLWITLSTKRSQVTVKTSLLLSTATTRLRAQDDGRGIPTGIHPEEGVSAAEVIGDRSARGR